MLSICVFLAVSAPRDPLYDAVFNADVDTVEGLLEEFKRDPNFVKAGIFPTNPNYIEHEHNRTALMMCGYKVTEKDNIKDRQRIDRACLSIAKMMHKAGANLTHVDKHGWSVLSMSVMRGLSQFSQYLIQNGANVNHADQDGLTPVMKSAAHGYLDTAAMLVQHGASLNHRDKQGRSALMLMVNQAMASQIFESKLRDFLERFILKSKEGAITKRKEDAKEKKLNKNGSKSTMGSSASITNSADTKGRSDTQTDENMQVPELHSATIDYPVDFHGRTPLHYAVIGRSLTVTRILLDFGADATLSDSFGTSTVNMVHEMKDKNKHAEMLLALQNSVVATMEKKHKQWLLTSEPNWEDL